MNVSGPTCWERFKECCCCKAKKLRPIRRSARIDNIVTKMVEPIGETQVQVDVKTHHIYKSTDMVTVLECLKQDNERLRYGQNNDGDKIQQHGEGIKA